MQNTDNFVLNGLHQILLIFGIIDTIVGSVLQNLYLMGFGIFLCCVGGAILLILYRETGKWIL